MAFAQRRHSHHNFEFPDYASLIAATTLSPNAGDTVLLTESGAVFEWSVSRWDSATSTNRTGWFNSNSPLIHYDSAAPQRPEVIPGVLYVDPGTWSLNAFSEPEHYRAIAHDPKGSGAAFGLRDTTYFMPVDGNRFLGTINHDFSAGPFTAPFAINVGDHAINAHSKSFIEFVAAATPGGQIQQWAVSQTPFAEAEPLKISALSPTAFVQPGSRIRVDVSTPYLALNRIYTVVAPTPLAELAALGRAVLEGDELDAIDEDPLKHYGSLDTASLTSTLNVTPYVQPSHVQAEIRGLTLPARNKFRMIIPVDASLAVGTSVTATFTLSDALGTTSGRAAESRIVTTTVQSTLLGLRYIETWLGDPVPFDAVVHLNVNDNAGNGVMLGLPYGSQSWHSASTPAGTWLDTRTPTWSAGLSIDPVVYVYYGGSNAMVPIGAMERPVVYGNSISAAHLDARFSGAQWAESAAQQVIGTGVFQWNNVPGTSWSLNVGTQGPQGLQGIGFDYKSTAAALPQPTPGDSALVSDEQTLAFEKGGAWAFMRQMKPYAANTDYYVGDVVAVKNGSDFTIYRVHTAFSTGATANSSTFTADKSNLEGHYRSIAQIFTPNVAYETNAWVVDPSTGDIYAVTGTPTASATALPAAGFVSLRTPTMSLNQLLDVGTSTLTPVDGDLLKFDGATMQWEVRRPTISPTPLFPHIASNSAHHGVKITASSYYNNQAQYQPRHVLYQTTTAEWATWGKQIADITFEMPGAAAIGAVFMQGRTGSSSEYFSSWLIEASNDNINWTTLHTGTTASWTQARNGQYEVFTAPNYTPFKWVRFRSTAGVGANPGFTVLNYYGFTY